MKHITEILNLFICVVAAPFVFVFCVVDYTLFALGAKSSLVIELPDPDEERSCW